MAGGGPSKKRPRLHNNRLSSSTVAVIDTSFPDKTSSQASQKPTTLRCSASSPAITINTVSGGFNDSSTADVILRLFLEPSPFDSSDSVVDQSDVQIYLHSDVLRRAKYFAALLSDRWQQRDSGDSECSLKPIRLNLGVSASTGSINNHYR